MPYRRCTYGTFTFDLHRLQPDEKILYSQNGIDQVGIETTFTIKGIFSASTTQEFAVLLSNANCQLTTPRLAFHEEWSDNNIDWWNFYTADSTTDIKWGPKPGKLDITEIIGGRSAIFTWSLTTRSKQCYDGSCSTFPLPSEVLSIARRYSHAVDASGFTTRVTSGKILITSQSVSARKPSDFYRNLVTPPVPKWFKRENQSFTSNEDGTEMDFSFTDSEKYWTLPTPIASGHASWRVTISNLGAIANYSLSGEFTGTNAATKLDMTKAVATLAADRFPIAAGLTVLLDEKMMEESIFDNKISFNITGHSATGTDPNQLNLQPVFNTFGAQPTGSDGDAQAIGAYGGNGTSINSGVIAPYNIPYDACQPPQNTSGGGSPGRTPQLGTGGNGTITTGVPTIGSGGAQPYEIIIPAQNNNISQAHMLAPWIAYYEETNYKIVNHIKKWMPKKKGAKPIYQQTAPPEMMIMQCGYAVRDAADSKNAPVAPPPVLFQNTTIIMADVSPVVPVQIGTTNFNRYKIEWNYLLSYNLTVDQDTLDDDMTFPVDPRRPATDPQPTYNNPTLIENL